jgi:hypothetical protein
MSISDSKTKNLKALYEQRRERITSRITEINLAEYSVRQYKNLKTKFGVLEGICVFGIVLIVAGGILKNPIPTLLLSSSMGFGFVSGYNIIKYKKLKKIKEENPNIDFHNYDFNENEQELNKLFIELFSIDNCLLNPIENKNNYVVKSKDDIKIYKSATETEIKEDTFEYHNYEEIEKNKQKIKKKGRR